MLSTMALFGLLVFQSSGTPTEITASTACPSTRTSSFSPPATFPTNQLQPHWILFGSDMLWTQINDMGIWSLPPSPDGRMRDKMFFWRKDYDPKRDPRPPLKVVARRLDRPDLVSYSEAATGSFVAGHPALVTAITIPSRGCWKVTAQYLDASLTFTTWVQ
jgi:hypothetical protein